jgi:Carboxypeptidase regulatory-like domain
MSVKCRYPLGLSRDKTRALMILCLSLGSSHSLLAQRSDRGIIGGLVTDAQGAALPGAAVIVRNEATGVESVLASNHAGAYTSAPLVLGPYSITVSLRGFKKAVVTGIELRAGDVLRYDIVLQIGEMTESVEVRGGDPLDVTRPDVNHSVDEKYYHDLPIVTAADVRLAESVLLMQPGYLPMSPNGDPSNRGSQFASRINGGQIRATENFFDGAAFGNAFAHQESTESAPPVEAIQEVTVVTTTYSAQYGHTSGGFIEYTSKSGANRLRGSAYGYLASDALNAKGFFAAPKSPLDNKSWGGTLGGPIVKNKTFFFVNADWTRIRSGTAEGFGNTTPIDAFRAGDFSALLTGTQIGVDALGRPLFEGQIFNPATTRLVNGVPVRDAYPGNVIPLDDPLLSTVASRYSSLMVHPDRPGLSNNVAGAGSQAGTWALDVRNLLLRLDHTFSPRVKATFSGYYNDRPAIRGCGGNQGCTVPNDPLSDSASNTEYIGQGFTQHIYTTHAHTQWDWIINNNLMSHSVVAWDRWHDGGGSLSAGASWPERLWGSQQASGLVVGDAGPPEIHFAGNIPYNPLGNSWPPFGYEKNDRWQFSTDLAWVRGRSMVKVGFEYRHHTFRHRGWGAVGAAGNFDFNRLETGGYDGAGNNLTRTGDPFASFLLGQVHVAFQSIYAQPTWYESYLSPWVNAELKVNPKLTVTAGLRLDYQTARTEQNDEYSTFDPTTPNPGAGNLPGAVIFAGSGPGRAGTRTFEDPKWDAWGPRVGFSYRVGDKTVVRGGYGIYYAGVAFGQFGGEPNIGFSSNPFALSLTNGLYPAFLLDAGFPTSNITHPPFIDPTIANGASVIAVAPDGETLPRFQNWSLTVQRRLTRNMILDVSYIGNRGSRLNHHAQRAGLDYNMNDPHVLSLGAALLNSPIDSPAAQAAGILPPYPGFNGTVAQALRKYPQYQSIEWQGLPLGRSQYHAIAVVLEQQLSKGLQYRVGYTYSRLKNNGAESGLGDEAINGGVQDPIHWDTADYGLSLDDTPHVLLAGFTWDIAPGRSRSWTGARKALLGGWSLSGILRYESGRPLRIVMANDMAELLFNTEKRPNRVGGSEGAASGFDPNTESYLNKSAWQDPGPLAFGNAPRADGTVRGFKVYNEDIAIAKTFSLTTVLKLRFEGLFGNIFNRTTFCRPDTNFSSPAFGTVNTQCNQARSIQFGLRLDY